MHLVILGNGVAGITAARHVRKRDPAAKITVVSGESDHHWSRPALMYVYMGHLRYQDTKPYEDGFWKQNRIDLVRGWVERIDTAERSLRFDDGRTLSYDALVIATGSVPNRFGWPGQDLRRVTGMYHLQDLIALEEAQPHLKHAVVVGGGLIGIELAEMLHSRHIPVTLLVREVEYWDNVLPPEEAAMISRAIREEGIDLRLQTELKAIHDDGEGAVGAVTTSAGDRIECQYVGLTAGVRPNLGALEGSGIETGRGVLVDLQLRTNVPDVYAIGDCAEIVHGGEGRNWIQAVWYTGQAMGETVAKTLTGEPTEYRKGTWYNSAKFLDIEYHVYGEVPNRVGGDLEHLYWEHPSGRKSLRLTHRDGRIAGFNVMGIRFRHRVCERWIEEGRTLDHVLEHIDEAWFDPEFVPRHVAEVQAALGGAR